MHQEASSKGRTVKRTILRSKHNKVKDEFTGAERDSTRCLVVPNHSRRTLRDKLINHKLLSDIHLNIHARKMSKSKGSSIYELAKLCQ